MGNIQIFCQRWNSPFELSLDYQHLCVGSRYWSNKAEYNVEKQLPPVFKDKLRLIFTSLTEVILFDRCLIGLTQNPNVSINCVLRSKCSIIKRIFSTEAKASDSARLPCQKLGSEKKNNNNNKERWRWPHISQEHLGCQTTDLDFDGDILQNK